MASGKRYHKEGEWLGSQGVMTKVWLGMQELVGDERDTKNKGALPVVDRSSGGLVRCLEAIDRPLYVHNRWFDSVLVMGIYSWSNRFQPKLLLHYLCKFLVVL
jgi:hypothetical protein